METTELTRWVMMSPDTGDELVEALRALGDALGRQPIWVEASGEIHEPQLSVITADGSRAERSLSGAWDMTSAQGHVTAAGETTLYVHLTREAGGGPQHAGGVLTAALVGAVQVRAALSTARVERPVAAPAVSAVPVAPEPAASPAVERPAQAPSSPGLQATPPQPAQPAMPIPKRPVRDLGPEYYPEEGDIVTHFAFGRCTVVMSDGERIRLQQESGSRVREVALSMLRVDEPTIGEDGKKHWELGRKN